MPRANPLQPAINAGEFSPRMTARVDFSKYPSAAAACRNMIPLAQGGVMRRPGTRFIATVKDSAAKCRLLRFEFSTEQAYVIEAGDGYFRFYRNQGRITVPDTDAAIANGTFDADISGWSDRSGAGSSIGHDAANGRLSLTSNGTTSAHAEQSVATADTGQEHVLRFRVIGAPGDKVKLRIGTTSTGSQIVNDIAFASGFHAYPFTPTASPFTVQFLHSTGKTLQIDDVALIDDDAMEVATPYATADLFALKTAQSADILYIAHPNYPIHKLARSGHTAWSLIEVAYLDGPYLTKNDAATTLTPSATSGLGISITASAAAGINGGDGFKANDVGRPVRIRHGTNEAGYALITGFTSATVVTADVKRAFNAATASADWRLGSWSATTGYPATVTFFEQRFCAARTTRQPQTFWLSQSADLENMRPDSYASGVLVEDDDALDFTIAADQANVIQWLSPGQQLALGTSGGAWVAESDGPILTPSDIQVRRQVTNGGADVEPVRIDDVAIFLQRGRRKIREFAFSFEADGFKSPDLTILADHITRSKIVEMAFQEEPDSGLWCVREDGALAVMTYRRDQDVVGWSRHVLGGTYQTGPAVVESVTTVPGADGGGQFFDSTERNEVWVIGKRTIGGALRRTVECLETEFRGPVRQDFASDADWAAAMIDTQQDAFYVDCGLSFDAPKTISGATQAAPVVITAAAHGFSDGDSVRIRGIKGMTELNGKRFRVANATADTFALTDAADGSAIDGMGFAVYVAKGQVRKEVTAIGGLAHLEGETVKILADGAIHPDTAVAGGDVTLHYPASRVHVGLGYAHQFQSLKINAGAAAGTAVGKTKRIHGITLLLVDAAVIKLGPSDGRLAEIDFREVADPMDTAVPLVTREHFVEFDGDYERDARIVIEGDAPAPFTLLALAPELKTNEQT